MKELETLVNSVAKFFIETKNTKISFEQLPNETWCVKGFRNDTVTQENNREILFHENFPTTKFLMTWVLLYVNLNEGN